MRIAIIAPPCLSTTPHDLVGFAAALSNLVTRAGAARMGSRGQRRTTELFGGDRRLEQWVQVFARLSRPARP